MKAYRGVGVAVATETAPGRTGKIWLGHTGLLVSPIGLGLAALGRPVYMAPGRDADLGRDRSVAAMRRRCQVMLDAAYAAGITYIDAARSYGLAEQFLNAWWNERGLPDHALTVGSKWGYTYTGRWDLDAPVHEVKHLTVDTLRRHAYQSGVILGSRLSLYQIHSATLDSGVLEDSAVLAELVRLRESGLCIGLTVTGRHQAETIRRALDVRIDGVRLFQTIQATWNLLDPSAGTALADASAEGVGVIVKEVLANGRLTDRYGGGRLRPLRVHAAELGTTVETVAIAAVRSQPWADIVLSGAVTCDQLRAHIVAGDVCVAADQFSSIAEPASEYWRRRDFLPWT
jgi:aryl-alcohol dehydrogenase-like predicted oxidoreductase